MQYIELESWHNTIVLYVLGEKPFFGKLRAYAQRVWRPKGSFEIFSRENGFFFVRFGMDEDVERVLQGGPWTFDGRLIIAKKMGNRGSM